MKKYILLLVLSLGTILSCEEDLVVFDGVNGQSFVKFESSAVNLPIPFADPLEVNVPISVSTISTVERTVTVSIVPEGTTLDAANYSFNSSVVIPANSYTGNLVITGVNESLVLGDIETIEFKLDTLSVGDSNIDGTTLTVSAFLNCPFDLESFVGTYSANEDGYCDGCYEVEVSLGTEPNTLIMSNLWEVGGTTTVTLLPDNDNKIDFTFGEFLYVNSTYGDASTYNPSAVTGSAADNIASFRTCDNYMNLYFRVCVDAGCFGLVHIQLTKI